MCVRACVCTCVSSTFPHTPAQDPVPSAPAMLYLLFTALPYWNIRSVQTGVPPCYCVSSESRWRLGQRSVTE